MPRPRKSHQEVVEERQAKEKELSRVQGKQAAAIARVAALEQTLGEDVAVCKTSESTPPAAQTASSPTPAVKSSEMKEVGEEAGEEEEKVEEDPPSEDEYRPNSADEQSDSSEEDKGPSEDDIDELGPDGATGVQPNTQHSDPAAVKVTAKSKAKTRVGRADVEVAKTSLGAVGKRKQVIDAVTPARASKKKKTTQVRTALVPDWENIVKSASRGRPAAPLTSQSIDIPTTAPSRRSTSTSSTATSVPDTSDVDTIISDPDDNCFLLNSTTNNHANDVDEDSESLDDIIAFSTATRNYRERDDSQASFDDHVLETTKADAGSAHKKTPNVLTKVVAPLILKNVSTAAGEGPAQNSTSPNETDTSNKTASAGGRSSARTQRGSGKRSKAKISDLPHVMREGFNARFVPLVRQYMGTLTPWQGIKLSELKMLHRKAFGEELSAQHPLEEGDNCFRLIHYRIDDWHSALGSTARATFEDILQYPANVAAHGNDPEKIAACAAQLLGDKKKNAPFYWGVWEDPVTGRPDRRLENELIVGTFAYHLSELLTVAPQERTQELPVGALTLSVLAATHALTHYLTGEWAAPKTRKGWFSEENYGDRIVFQDGGNAWDRRMTRVLKVVKDLNDEDAYQILQERSEEEKKRRGKKGLGTLASGVEVIVEDDDDLMLVAHSEE
ncbi:hypothetical protein C8Q79DRAFT_1111723 [Trametes meyenii]|nr:hypothetical protein C8Q79DRAFT_1111723 [Trametes meyenii]